MKKKRIVQYCCAALVALGVGLNIQNAIADYGMNKNTLSLVAECITYATGGTLGWCSYVNVTNYYSNSTQYNPNQFYCSYSNGREIEKEGTIEQCCDRSGRWHLVFYLFPDGQEEYLRGWKLTYQRWNTVLGYPVAVPNPDGSQTIQRPHWRNCEEYSGSSESNCPYKGGSEYLGIY